MKSQRKKVNLQSAVVDGHNHIMMELGKRRNRGDKSVFSNYYVPLLRERGINVVMLVVGGDNTCLTNDSDLMLWGSLWVVDMLWQEAEESKDSISICLNLSDIERTVAEGKIAILLTMEGARPLEGKPNLETMAGLRAFYKLGVRSIQLVDNGRNRIGDGKGESRTNGGLTSFGIAVIEEMNRLGMLIDVAHLTEPGFWDVVKATREPIIDSHSNCRAVCDHPRNLTDDQIKAIAQGGGVIGMSCNAALTSKRDRPTVQSLIEHVDYIVKLVGVDHVAFGPDITEFEMECNIWTPAPGWLEGVFYGVKDTYLIEGQKSVATFPLFREELVKRGYSQQDIQKIIGGNWLRVYKQVIG